MATEIARTISRKLTKTGEESAFERILDKARDFLYAYDGLSKKKDSGTGRPGRERPTPQAIPQATQEGAVKQGPVRPL